MIGISLDLETTPMTPMVGVFDTNGNGIFDDNWGTNGLDDDDWGLYRDNLVML